MAKEELELFEGEGPAVLFLHGVTGHYQETWTHDETKFCWPQALHEKTGWTVASLGYPAGILFHDDTMELAQRAGNLLERLGVSGWAKDRPLAIVAHSFGGLIAKQMVRHSVDRQGSRWFRDQIRAIGFVATPHRGSNLADLAETFKGLTGANVTPEQLQFGNRELEALHKWYVDRHGDAPRIENKNFAESDALDLSDYWKRLQGSKIAMFFARKASAKVVEPFSAELGVPGVDTVTLDGNHMEVCKPESEGSLAYVSVEDFLRGVFESSPQERGREQVVAAAKQAVANESPAPSEDAGPEEKHSEQREQIRERVEQRLTKWEERWLERVAGDLGQDPVAATLAKAMLASPVKALASLLDLCERREVPGTALAPVGCLVASSVVVESLGSTTPDRSSNSHAGAELLAALLQGREPILSFYEKKAQTEEEGYRYDMKADYAIELANRRGGNPGQVVHDSLTHLRGLALQELRDRFRIAGASEEVLLEEAETKRKSRRPAPWYFVFMLNDAAEEELAAIEAMRKDFEKTGMVILGVNHRKTDGPSVKEALRKLSDLLDCCEEEGLDAN